MSSLSARVILAAPLGRVIVVLAILAGILPARAEPPRPASPPPAQVQQLLGLLQDPMVRAWINEQRAPETVTLPPAEDTPVTTSAMMTRRIDGLQQHLAALMAAVPRLPNEFGQARLRLIAEHHGRSGLAVLLLLAGFLGLGAGSEWLFRRATASIRQRGPSRPSRTESERLRILAGRLALDSIGVSVFAVGSVGAFLAFTWPPLLRQVVVSYLAAAVLLRFALVLGRFLLAPHADTPESVRRFRLLPMDTGAARWWYRRLAFLVGWLAIGWATVEMLGILGFSPEAQEVVAYALGMGLLAIAIHAVWVRPPPGTSPEQDATGWSSHSQRATLLSICFVLLWALWVAGLTRLFWLGAVALLLPQALSLADRASRHAMSPPAEATRGDGLTAVYLGRSVRALLIFGAVLLLAHIWDIDLIAMTSNDTLLTHVVRGTMSGVVILLVADLIWQVAKTLIDRRLAHAGAAGPPGSSSAQREARLRTLLPILRHAILAVLATIAVMMVLSALGVEVGPLIAGAGIIGVAVGFGSQALVKDIVSGIFYLLDDAFRIGEYIQSGKYKGTVETFSLRSVKLRHHRGPVYTVPFGELGAVENMSRDWVIDKFEIGLTYDSDLEKARKLIKKIGQEMAADPEFADHIIEPLKMQGVEQFGEYAVQIRCKMTTQPGEQFVIRRKAYARIKQSFEENGIRFAFPTVQVAGGGETTPAAAHGGLQLIKPAGLAE